MKIRREKQKEKNKKKKKYKNKNKTQAQPDMRDKKLQTYRGRKRSVRTDKVEGPPAKECTQFYFF